MQVAGRFDKPPFLGSSKVRCDAEMSGSLNPRFSVMRGRGLDIRGVPIDASGML